MKIVFQGQTLHDWIDGEIAVVATDLDLPPRVDPPLEHMAEDRPGQAAVASCSGLPRTKKWHSSGG